MRRLMIAATLLLGGATTPSIDPTPLLLRPLGVFDGLDGKVHTGWHVLAAASGSQRWAPDLAVPAGARVIDLAGDTLMPGMDVRFWRDHGPCSFA